jgi:Fur family ferric uptake transcriptional regulator
MLWEDTLKQAGFRVTASRRVIIQVLLDSNVPLLPQEILERGRHFHGSLGLVTVYRTLALLAELKLVRRVHCQEGCHGYVVASPGHRHHVICRQCGRAVEFLSGDDVCAFVAQAEAKTGYRVDDHLLQLVGLCPACQAQAA